jgi:hypothetical protein
MGDLKDARLMYLKAVLFLLIGIMSITGILVTYFSWQIVLLLLLTIWSFCRLYYFCFYVIEKYIDPQFKFAGLYSVFVYLWKKSRAAKKNS